MKDHSLGMRAAFYSDKFPDYPPLRTDSRWLDGMWVLGRNYQVSGFYGSFPPTFVSRIMSLFPDAENVLHLFSGSLQAGPWKRLDSVESADIKGDAEELSRYVQVEEFDLIVADPPYSVEDAEHYGQPMVNRNKVVKECEIVLRKGGFLVWLDQVLPMFRKDSLHLCGLIGVVRSTNHRFRVCSIFKKQ